jgi:diguanylate cyclase (GGDEF)-like protein
MLAVLLAVAAAIQAPQPFPVSGVAELGGGWRFAIGDGAGWALPAHPDSGWRRVVVPSTWGDAGFPGYRGYTWYRLRYQMDSTVAAPMGLRFASVATAYQVFVDGRRIGGVGSFPPRYDARSNVPVNFALPREALTRGEHVLAVQVYSAEGTGGIVGPVLAGPLAALDARDARISFLLVGTALLLIGISVNLLFYWGRRPEVTEHLYLFVHIFALGLLFLVWVPPFRVWLSDSLDFYRLYLLLAGLAAAFFCFAFRRLLDLDRHRGVAGLGFLFVMLGFIGLVAPGWGELRAIGMYLLDPALILASLVVIGLAFQQLRRGVEDAKPLLWGITFFVATLLHDVLGEWGVIVSLGVPWIYAGAIAFVLTVSWVTTRKIVDTASIALNDRLTGLYRREVVLDALKREIRRAARTQQPLALIMMDLDNFKAVNDGLGHQAGDRVLAEVGRRLAEAGRAVDWLCRYGGEEFLAVLAGADELGARNAGERFRGAVGALSIDAGRASRVVTLSAGVTVYDGGPEWPTVETLVGAADAALFRAKGAGKNRVEA